MIQPPIFQPHPEIEPLLWISLERYQETFRIKAFTVGLGDKLYCYYHIISQPLSQKLDILLENNQQYISWSNRAIGRKTYWDSWGLTCDWEAFHQNNKTLLDSIQLWNGFGI